MIYTVTLNPSIDYVADVSEFINGGLNRTASEAFFVGGKGINVSIVLKNLGIESMVLGFVAGFTGDKIESMLHEKGISTDFVRLTEGNSRINVKMHSLLDDTETEINGCGPQISESSIGQLLDKLCKLNKGDILIMAGSIPPSVKETIYERICALLHDKGVKMIVDAENQLLLNVLKYRPFLVKPNHHELGQVFGVTLHTKHEVILYARQLQQMGAENVLVSMAGDGAVFLNQSGEVYEMAAPKGKVVNSVGAGDSMLAGFLAGADRGMQEALRTAVCAGSACAFLKGLPEREDIDTLKHRQIQIIKLTEKGYDIHDEYI